MSYPNRPKSMGSRKEQQRSDPMEVEQTCHLVQVNLHQNSVLVHPELLDQSMGDLGSMPALAVVGLEADLVVGTELGLVVDMVELVLVVGMEPGPVVGMVEPVLAVHFPNSVVQTEVLLDWDMAVLVVCPIVADSVVLALGLDRYQVDISLRLHIP
jgi:hypothetical protein